MKSKQDIFFYRDKQFQNTSKTLWGMDLFVENTQTPEKFQSFWDNIYTIKSNLDREEYANGQCNILKNIKIVNMEIEFKKGDGLYIRDKEDDDVEVVLDYRESGNGELRGENLANALQEYAETHKDGSVYDALNNLLRSHHNPTFAVGVRGLRLEEWCYDIVFNAIDVVLTWINKLKSAKPSTPQDKENKKQIDEKFHEFLAILDEENIKALRNELETPTFSEEQYSSARKNAIEKLLTYRETLFEETKTVGINLEDSRKASKCHFSEQMITALSQDKPEEGQSFDQYINSCIRKAEANLTPEEVTSWPKGVFSHRLFDIVTELKNMEPEDQEVLAPDFRTPPL